MHGRLRRYPGSANLRRRGRSATVTLAVFWTVTQVSLGRAVDASLWLRDPPFADKKLKYANRAVVRSTPASRAFNLVFVGSSRTSFGVRGDIVENAAATPTDRPVAVTNFGFPASGPVANLLNVHRLVAGADAPDFIVIEVHPALLAEINHLAPEQPFLSPERLRHDEVEMVIAGGLPAAETRRRWWMAELVPEYGLRFPLLSRIAEVWLPLHLRMNAGRATDATGWQASKFEPPTLDDYQRGVRHAYGEYFNLLQCLRFDTAPARAVGSALAECRHHSVRVALLLMPEGSEFRSWYPSRVEADLYEYLGRLCREYGVPLIDARGWLADNAFLDAHHLTRAGATEFSERLGRAMAMLIPPAQ